MTASDEKMKVFDVHQHLGALDVVLGQGPGMDLNDMQLLGERHAAHLDRFGMSCAAMMPMLSYERPNGIVDTQAVNDRMAEFRAANRERFPVALGTVEPLYGVDACLEELRRIAEDLRLDGVAWHNRFQGTSLGDRRMHALVEPLADYGLPAFVHVMSESTLEAPWALEELARAHPEVTFVACDAFSGITQTKYIEGVAERCPNVMFDTAMCIPLGRPLEIFVRKFGADRLMFGTDVYTEPDLYAHCQVLDELRASELDDQALERILWGNAASLFQKALAAKP